MNANIDKYEADIETCGGLPKPFASRYSTLARWFVRWFVTCICDPGTAEICTVRQDGSSATVRPNGSPAHAGYRGCAGVCWHRRALVHAPLMARSMVRSMVRGRPFLELVRR